MGIRLPALILLSLLGGCSALTFSEADCRGMNWQQRGHDDGFGGHPPQDLRLVRQCARYGVQVAQADYAKGWAVGNDEHVRLKAMKCD
jgi:uncharacterized protein DUF2799